MWSCTKCDEKVPDNFEICYQCGTSRDGVEDPDFLDSAEDQEPSPENLPIQEGIARNLATIDRCILPAEAHAKKMHLEAEGIPVFLADELTIAMDWLLANAIGGIKIQVPLDEAERAQAILEEFAEKHGSRRGRTDEDENEENEEDA